MLAMFEDTGIRSDFVLCKNFVLISIQNMGYFGTNEFVLKYKVSIIYVIRDRLFYI